jgi:hypothetical protein
MPFAVSDDGYVRCTYALLQSVGLTHLNSGLDDDAERRLPDTALTTGITGYTEWMDSHASLITIGWDWRMSAADGMVSLIRDGEPRSNVMFVDSSGADIGLARTATLLGELVDAFEWQSGVRHSIAIRYGVAHP